jgi:flagellum-specific peptidoglycan hydrolase FlgJ
LLEDSYRDYVWLITHGDRYQQVWASYEVTRNLPALIDGVARVYANDSEEAFAAGVWTS